MVSPPCSVFHCSRDNSAMASARHVFAYRIVVPNASWLERTRCQLSITGFQTNVLDVQFLSHVLVLPSLHEPDHRGGQWSRPVTAGEFSVCAFHAMHVPTTPLPGSKRSETPIVHRCTETAPLENHTSVQNLPLLWPHPFPQPNVGRWPPTGMATLAPIL